MQGVRRLACAICMILILIFAIIHLGVAGGIIGRFNRYGNIFRPEIGLAAFNIAIGVYAFLIGIFGLFAVLTDRGRLSTVVGFAAVLLALFTLLSLIAALIINSLTINYVNSRFLSHMTSYPRNLNSRNIIDRIQTKYVCCGSSSWLDWSRVSLNATGSSTSRPPTSVTTTASGNVTSTVTALPGNGSNTTTTVSTVATATTGSIITDTVGTEPIITDTTGTEPVVVGVTTTGVVTALRAATVRTITRAANRVRRFDNTVESPNIEKDARSRLFNDIMEDADTNFLLWGEITGDFNYEEKSSKENIRRRRQAQTNYGGIYGLPSNFNVTLPQSCCTNGRSTIGSLSNSYCISNANNGSNSIHPKGCMRPLGKDAVGQTLGLAVINSFLFILSLAAIPLLIETDLKENSPQNGHINQPSQHPQYHFMGHNQASHNPGPHYNAYNPGMSHNAYDPGMSHNAYDPGMSHNAYNSGMAYNAYDPGTSYNAYNPGMPHNAYDPGMAYNAYNNSGYSGYY